MPSSSSSSTTNSTTNSTSSLPLPIPPSPSDTPMVKSADGLRVLPLFLPSPPASSPPPVVDPPPPATQTSSRRTKPAKPPHLLRLICAFLRSERFLHGSVDLEIPSVGRKEHQLLLAELRSPRILSGKEADSLRYDYSPETSTLTIPCMPSPVHDGVLGFSGDVILEMRETNHLSRAERRSIVVNAGTDVALPTLRSLSRKGSKSGGTAVKQPDAAYYFIDRASPAASDRCPRVVFEVAFSQSYESVKQDAHHWLLRAQGFVKLVILIKLYEGSHPEAEIDHEEIERKALEQDLALDDDSSVDNQGSSSSRPESPAQDPGTEIGEESETAIPSPTSSQSSTAQDYNNYFKADPTPWVGPITGFIELYRYEPETNTVYQDGPRCDIFAPVSDDVIPKIKITDLLPLTHIEGDRERSFTLPLDMYRYHIAVGVHKLAANRRAHHHQVQRKRKGDGDASGLFVPKVGGGGKAGREETEGSGSGEVPKRRKRNEVGV